MNFSCSTCLESFTPNCDISSTPCGHVFHTDCINRWMENEREECGKCRRECRNDQIIKLYFSENESALEDNKARLELEEENLKLKQDNLKLSKKCQDLKSDFQKTEKNLNEGFQSVTDENLKLTRVHNQELLLIKQTTKRLEKEVTELKKGKEMKNNQYNDELSQFQAEFNAKIEKLKNNELNENPFEEIPSKTRKITFLKLTSASKVQLNRVEHHGGPQTKKIGPKSKTHLQESIAKCENLPKSVPKQYHSLPYPVQYAPMMGSNDHIPILYPNNMFIN